MKKILVNKIGYEHHEEWRNCQDYGFVNEKMLCVVDGCSEGKNSEIGSQLFCHLFMKTENIEETFETLTTLYTDFEEMKNHLLFTILFVTEDEENFYVNIAGDGYIIKQNFEDQLLYEKIEFDNSPPYYSYNFVDKKYLKKYQDGVNFETRIYPKSKYKAVGVATDGLEYMLRSPFKKQFETYLLERKEFAIKRLINREHHLFKDDITFAI